MAISRRAAVQALGMIGAGSLVGTRVDAAEPAGALQVAGQAVELTITAVGPDIVRPLDEGKPRKIVADGSLVAFEEEEVGFRTRVQAEPRSFACGNARITVATDPLAI